MADLYIGGTWTSARDEGHPRDPLSGRRFARRRRGRGGRQGHGRRDRGRAPRLRRGPLAPDTPNERGDLLLRVADLLARDKDVLARAESLDTGKRLVESEYDIDDIENCFRYFGRLVASESGRVVETGTEGVDSRVVYEPVGVCALITPWNYPLLQTAWKVAPALAAGNTFVLKPSELTPHTAIHLMRLLEEAGVPAGRGQPGPRRRSRGRRSAGRPSGRGPRVLHRRSADRPQTHGRGGRDGEEGRPRTGRQEPEHRLRRRRLRDGRRHGVDGRLPAFRAGLLGRGAAPGRGLAARPVRRRGRPQGPADQAGRTVRRAGADRAADLGGTPGEGRGVRRQGPGGGRGAALRRGAAGRSSAPGRLLLPADRARRVLRPDVGRPGGVLRARC